MNKKPDKKLAKKDEQELSRRVLELYLEGNNQKEIYERLSKGLEKNGKKVKSKRLKTIIYENDFLSPKNLRLGTLLLFCLTLITPPVTVYLRGFEYHTLVYPMLTLSIIFSTPYLILGILMRLTKKLQNLEKLSLYMLGYTVVYLLTYFFISVDIKIWTMVLFPLILFPTLINEYLKLQHLNRFAKEYKKA